jgi:hypothetical protein
MVCQILYESTPPKGLTKFTNVSLLAINPNTLGAPSHQLHPLLYPMVLDPNPHPSGQTQHSLAPSEQSPASETMSMHDFFQYHTMPATIDITMPTPLTCPLWSPSPCQQGSPHPPKHACTLPGQRRAWHWPETDVPRRAHDAQAMPERAITRPGRASAHARLIVVILPSLPPLACAITTPPAPSWTTPLAGARPVAVAIITVLRHGTAETTKSPASSSPPSTTP